jgi:D-proline reductase (dithiol) PrdB
VGLIQREIREIEKAGASTIGISLVRGVSEKIRPPRTVFLPWPFGHPLGEPFDVVQQRTVLLSALHALQSITTPGSILDLPYRWRTEKRVLNKVSPEASCPTNGEII